MAKKNTDYKNKFAKENYDRVSIAIPKGKKAEWQKKAKAEGLSLSALIQKQMDLDLKNEE